MEILQQQLSNIFVANISTKDIYAVYHVPFHDIGIISAWRYEKVHADDMSTCFQII